MNILQYFGIDVRNFLLTRKKRMCIKPEKRKAGFYRKNVYFSEAFPFFIGRAIHTPERFNESMYFCRDFWKVTYVIAGAGEKIINSLHFPIHPGSIMLIHPNAQTTYKIESDSIEIFNLVFMPDLILPYIREISTDFDFFSIFQPNEPLRQALYIFDGDKKFRGIIEEIEAEYERRSPNYQAMIRVLLVGLLIRMARKGAREFRKHSDTNVTAYVNHIIETRFHEDFNLDMISNQVGLNKSRLCLIYRRTCATTIINALCCRRLGEAQKLLADSELGITDICYRVGFNDLSYFYRRFVREFGMTPCQYRKNGN